MSNPNDPMYQGQALGQQSFGAPPAAAPGAGLGLLEAFGHLAVAGFHFFAGDDDEAGEEVEEAPRRRPRARAKGSCCIAKRPTKP